MEKVKAFFIKPKNIYLSLLFMFILVMGLTSISFSYYVDESTNNTKLVELKKIDNRLTSDELVDGKLILGPNETKDIVLYVMNNNDFDTIYKLLYSVDSEYVDVVLNNDINETINAKDVHMIDLTVENYDDKTLEVLFDIESGYVGSKISYSDKEVVEK